MIHKTLKLQHHQHTAKRLPHEHTSYRGLFLVLLVSLLCLSAIQGVRADDYTVSATVPAASFTMPATITSPPNGSVLYTNTVELKGTCQVVVLGTIVVIERDGVSIGSQACESNGTFAITVPLIEGQNSLLPKEFSGGGASGPDGSVTTIVYQLPPAAPPATSGTTSGPVRSSGGSTSEGLKPLVIHLNRPFLVYQRGEAVDLPLQIEGGTAPYTLRIDWGDQKVDEWDIPKSGARNFEHTYTTANAYKIHVIVLDASGRQYAVQIGTINFTPPSIAFVSPINPAGSLKAWFDSPLTRIVWGAYLLICILTIALWWASPTHTLFWNELAPGRALFKRRP